jgi:RNA recognition motif-containing protein
VRAPQTVHHMMRSARIIIVYSPTRNMKTQSHGRGSRRGRGRSGRRSGDARTRSKAAPKRKGFWSKIADFFGSSKAQTKTAGRNGSQRERQLQGPRPQQRKPEPVEVTSPRLYVGNLSFDATESDLFELFNGVGHVQNAEVVSYKHNQRSKGFAFVQMQTVEEAKRAVAELHDKEFLGRKLVVSGAKTSEHSRP